MANHFFTTILIQKTTNLICSVVKCVVKFPSSVWLTTSNGVSVEAWQIGDSEILVFHLGIPSILNVSFLVVYILKTDALNLKVKVQFSPHWLQTLLTDITTKKFPPILFWQVLENFTPTLVIPQLHSSFVIYRTSKVVCAVHLREKLCSWLVIPNIVFGGLTVCCLKNFFRVLQYLAAVSPARDKRKGN